MAVHGVTQNFQDSVALSEKYALQIDGATE